MVMRRVGGLAVATIVSLSVCGCFAPAESEKSPPASAGSEHAAAPSSKTDAPATKGETQVASITRPAGNTPAAPAKNDTAKNVSKSEHDTYSAGVQPELSRIRHAASQSQLGNAA
jgi:hypothetical protein